MADEYVECRVGALKLSLPADLWPDDPSQQQAVYAGHSSTPVAASPAPVHAGTSHNWGGNGGRFLRSSADAAPVDGPVSSPVTSRAAHMANAVSFNNTHTNGPEFPQTHSEGTAIATTTAATSSIVELAEPPQLERHERIPTSSDARRNAWEHLRTTRVGGWLCAFGSAREAQSDWLSKRISLASHASDDNDEEGGEEVDENAVHQMEELVKESLNWTPLYDEKAVLCVYSMFGNSTQIGAVREPGGMIEQLTFFQDRVSSFMACPSPRGLHAGAFIFLSDRHGDEHHQVYYHPGISAYSAAMNRADLVVHPIMLTDPRFRYESARWRPDGRFIAYSGNVRNGRDMDIYVRGMTRLEELFPDLFPPTADQLVSNPDANARFGLSREGQGMRALRITTRRGHWLVVDWSADGKTMLVEQYVSSQERHLFLLNVPVALTAARAVQKFERANDDIEVDTPEDYAYQMLLAELDAALEEVAQPLEGEQTSYAHTARFSNKFTCVGGKPGIFLAGDNNNAEFKQLKFYDIEAKAYTQDISGHIPWDVEEFTISPDARVGVFVVNESGASRLYRFDADEEAGGYRVSQIESWAGEESLATIESLKWHPGPSKSVGPCVAFTLDASNHPADAFVLELRTNTLCRWTQAPTAGFSALQFAIPKLVTFPSFDGLQISAWLYSPTLAFTSSTDDSPSVTRPVLIRMHGGPAAQSRPSFSKECQRLCKELDMVVIVPNVRGSTGYGRSFMALDDCEKRADSVKDVGALLDWIEGAGGQQFNLNPQRVGIKGVSYGGFMVLASLIAYGSRIKAGIDMVGISHFVTFLENTGEYRRHRRRWEYGDERDPEQRAFLHRLSPLTNADKLVSPLLVGQGLHDPRVPVSEAEQIVSAVRANGVRCWYVLGTNEGHGFLKKDNAAWFSKLEVEFLCRELCDEVPRPVFPRTPLALEAPATAANDSAVEMIRSVLDRVDLDEMTPKQALDLVYELKEKLELLVSSPDRTGSSGLVSDTNTALDALRDLTVNPLNPLPFLISVPHGGLGIPPEVANKMMLSMAQLEADLDGGSWEIYGQLRDYVRAYVASNVARAIVDVNRFPDDIGRKDGAIKTHSSYDVPIYDEPLSDELVETLLRKYHAPYHDRLAMLSAGAVRDGTNDAGLLSGCVMGIDCHTMAAIGPTLGPDAGQVRPAVCISNAGGTCPKSWFKAMVAAFRAEFRPFEVAANDPFKGGAIVRMHSALFPWVQIELSRDTTMSDNEKAQRLIRALERFSRDANLAAAGLSGLGDDHDDSTK